MNSENRPFVIGDQVHLIGDVARSYPRVGNGYGNLTVRPDQEMTVTRLYNRDMVIRGHIVRAGGGVMIPGSVQVRRDDFQLVDPNRPQPRRLGTKPDDTQEMVYIGLDDPRIQWLFEDMGKFATDKGYCNEYDALCARLGIPGRPREFTVKFRIGGIDATTKVMARSQKEANDQVAEATKNTPEFEPIQ